MSAVELDPRGLPEVAERADLPYWQGLAQGELRMSRCASCARWQWPALWRCPGCGSFEFDWPVVEPRGVVYAWTRTHYPFVPAYAELVPYVNVLVAMPEAGGGRLFGLLRGSEDGLRIGAPVSGIIEAPSEMTFHLPALRWGLVTA